MCIRDSRRAARRVRLREDLQRELVREMLSLFGHAERRAALPTGTVEEALG